MPQATRSISPHTIVCCHLSNRWVSLGRGARIQHQSLVRLRPQVHAAHLIAGEVQGNGKHVEQRVTRSLRLGARTDFYCHA